MSIWVSCSKCQKSHSVSIQAVGKTAKCSCGFQFKIENHANEFLQSSLKIKNKTLSKRKLNLGGRGSGFKKSNKRKRRSNGTSNKKKNTLLVPGLMLAFAMVTTAAVYKFSHSGHSAMKGSINILNFVPKEAKNVGKLNLARLTNSSLWSTSLAISKENQNENHEKFEDFLDKTGIDPKKDLQEAIFVSMSEFNGNNSNDQEGLLVMSGKFKAEAILKEIQNEMPKHGTRVSLEGYPSVQFKKIGDEKEAIITIADNRVLLLGTMELVKKSLAQYKSNFEHTDNETSVHLKKSSLVKGNLLWFSSEIAPTKKELNKQAGQFGPDLSSVRHIIVGVNLKDKKFSTKVNMTCLTVKDANTLKSSLQSSLTMLSGMAGMFTQGDPDTQKTVMALIKSIKIDTTGKELSIVLNIDDEMSHKIKEAIENTLNKQLQASNSTNLGSDQTHLSKNKNHEKSPKAEVVKGLRTSAEALISKVRYWDGHKRADKIVCDVVVKFSGDEARAAYAIGPVEANAFTADGKRFEGKGRIFGPKYQTIDRNKQDLKEGIQIDYKFEKMPKGFSGFKTIKGSALVFTGGVEKVLNLGNILELSNGVLSHPVLKKIGLEISYETRKREDGDYDFDFEMKKESLGFVEFKLMKTNAKKHLRFGSSSFGGDMMTYSTRGSKKSFEGTPLKIIIREGSKKVYIPFESKVSLAKKKDLTIAKKIEPNSKLEYKVHKFRGKEYVKIVKCDKKVTGKVVIPATLEGKSVTKIGVSSFEKCESLKHVILPDSVKEIGTNAFAHSGLESIVLSDKITVIHNVAFGFCKKLKNITVPKSVTSIGSYTFGYCPNLKSITFEGDAPRFANNTFEKSPVIVYRKPGTKGWGKIFAGKSVNIISD